MQETPSKRNSNDLRADEEMLRETRLLTQMRLAKQIDCTMLFEGAKEMREVHFLLLICNRFVEIGRIYSAVSRNILESQRQMRVARLSQRTSDVHQHHFTIMLVLNISLGIALGCRLVFKIQHGLRRICTLG